jgi:rhodanese-related sulfurtransferase
MICTEVRRTVIHKRPSTVDASELNDLLGSFPRPDILDVREESLFRAGHVEGSIHAPDSNITGLLVKVGKATRVVLVCDDGHLSSTVAKMLGVCGYLEVTSLKGGLKAWKEAGHGLNETTSRGEERRVHEGGDPDGPGAIGRLFARLTPPVFFTGLAGAAALVGGLALFLCR